MVPVEKYEPKLCSKRDGKGGRETGRAQIVVVELLRRFDLQYLYGGGGKTERDADEHWRRPWPAAVAQGEQGPHEECDGIVGNRDDDFYVHKHGYDAADDELGVGDCHDGFGEGGGAEAGERARDAKPCSTLGAVCMGDNRVIPYLLRGW